MQSTSNFIGAWVLAIIIVHNKQPLLLKDKEIGNRARPRSQILTLWLDLPMKKHLPLVVVKSYSDAGLRRLVIQNVAHKKLI